ncbi:MAG: hypothetical protein ACR2HG_14795 [Pyrinomonadaceae bacterium]
MENREKINPQEIQIQGLLDRYLRSRKSNRISTPAQEPHLDQDLLTAFTEGNLSEREAKPVVSHLVDCSFCRHVTAELIKLDLAFADEAVKVTADKTSPSKISEVLNNLLSRIFGANEGAVFAHQEKEEDSEKTKDSEDGEK